MYSMFGFGREQVYSGRYLLDVDSLFVSCTNHFIYPHAAGRGEKLYAVQRFAAVDDKVGIRRIGVNAYSLALCGGKIGLCLDIYRSYIATGVVVD